MYIWALVSLAIYNHTCSFVDHISMDSCLSIVGSWQWGASFIYNPTKQKVLPPHSALTKKHPAMGGKKALGENSKKAAGNARKAESAAKKAAEESARKAQLEDQEWSKGAKSNAKKYTHSFLSMLSPLSFKSGARAICPA